MISAERRISPSQRKGETGRPSLQEVIELMQKEYMRRQAEASGNEQEEIQVDDGETVIKVPTNAYGSGGADQSVNPAPTSIVIDIPHEGQDEKILAEEIQVDDGHTAIDIGEAIGGHGNGNGGQDGDAKTKTKTSEPTEAPEPAKSFSPLNVNASDLMALLAIETKPEGGQTTVDVKEGGGEKGRKDAKRPGRRLRERTRRERFMDAVGDVWWEIKYSFKHPPLCVFFLLAFVFMVLFLVGIGLTFFNVGDPSHGSSPEVVEVQGITGETVDGDSFMDAQAPLELELLEEAWGPGDHPPGQ